MGMLDGVTAVAEYTSKFEADLVAERLKAAGIPAVVVGDPAAQVAPHLAIGNLWTIGTTPDRADDAHTVIDNVEASVEVDDPEAIVASPKSTAMKLVGWVLLASILIPVAIGIFATLF